MPTSGIRDQIKRARRLIADHLGDPDARRRQEQRLATWDEPAEDFLQTVSLVLALAMYQAQREAVSTSRPETSKVFWENTAQFLGPDSGPERLFTGLPTDLDPDSQRQVQAIRLASAGISPTTNIRWLRLLQTARDVAEHHP